MRQIIITANEAGQRLDKFLHKYLKEAPDSFLYKMMRKKNIVLNAAKCSGSEKLSVGDEVKLFFSEETFEKMGAGTDRRPDTSEYERAFDKIGPLPVVWEDDHVLAVNKPAGILSQKAQPNDVSLNEWLTGYLLKKNALSAQELATFKPSVCNRLDRNTSGLVLCSKSLEGSQFLTGLIRDRKVRKFYRLFVKGVVERKEILHGWIQKDDSRNQVHILDCPKEDAQEIQTGISPLQYGTLPGGIRITYLEAELFTGKTHQIRAHLASVGHPLLGDPKYGDKKVNEICQKRGITRQMLHACRAEFPDELSEPFTAFSHKKLTAPADDIFERLLTDMVNEKR